MISVDSNEEVQKWLKNYKADCKPWSDIRRVVNRMGTGTEPLRNDSVQGGIVHRTVNPPLCVRLSDLSTGNAITEGLLCCCLVCLIVSLFLLEDIRKFLLMSL